jgi:hypothetical protein
LTVTVASSAGGQAINEVSVITAAGNFANGGPVAVDDVANVVAGANVVIAVTGNDSTDATGNISIATQPLQGTVVVNQVARTITYTSTNPAFAGEDTFSYVVRNAAAVRSNTATVTVITTAGP